MGIMQDLEYVGLGDRRYEFLAGCLFAGFLLSLLNPILFIVGPVLMIGVPTFLAENKRQRVRGRIPDLALEISSLWGFLPLKEILYRTGEETLVRAARQIDGGVPVRKALDEAAREEPQLGPLISLVSEGYTTGTDIASVLKDMADDFAEEAYIKEEIKSSLTLEKLTMLAAGTFLVPFILGAMVSLVGSLQFGGLMSIGMKGPSAQVKEMAMLGNRIYVIEYAALTAGFLGMSEGKWKKAIFYLGLLVPIAYITFTIGTGFRI